MKKSGMLVVAAVVLIAGVGQARAQTSAVAYSVKFLCGLQTVPSTNFVPPRQPTVKPGSYSTAVNVHNFNVGKLTIREKAIIATPQSQPRGRISKIFTADLFGNQALELDCNEIIGLFTRSGITLTGTFITGFMEIVSPFAISVEAVYTSQTCTNPGPGKCTMLGELNTQVVPQAGFASP